MSTQPDNSDAAPPALTRYYTQHRQTVTIPGQQTYDTGWTFACNGHPDQISAIGCHDATKQSLAIAIKGALTHAPCPGGQVGVIRVRIVKIVTTTEIVEEATEVEAEAK